MMIKELARTSKQTIKRACRTKHNTAQYLFTMQRSSISKHRIQEIFFQLSLHSRPQSSSFLGHVVGKRLQIKPSGSGDENVIFSSLEALARSRDIYANLLSANAVQKSANEEEIEGKDGKYRICIPAYMGL